MISINSDEVLQQVSKLKDKFDKYPPYALGKGLDVTSEYLNTPEVKRSIYPPSQSGQPFVWSTERQRRYVMANIRLPSVRTYNLADSGNFKVDKSQSSLYVYYENLVSYAKWVIGSFTQIIGHITRGWKPVNTIVTDRYRSEVVSRFREAVLKAWDEMSGQAPGL